MDKKTENAVKWFLAGLINEKWILKSQRKLWYDPKEKHSLDTLYVIDDKYAKTVPDIELRKIMFDFWDSMLAEFFGRWQQLFEIPVFYDGKDSTKIVIDMLRLMAKERLIDDLLYSIYRVLITTLKVFYDAESGKIWFGTGWWKKVVRLQWRQSNILFSEMRLEDILEEEVRQWFINSNPLVWDPEMKNAYTHRLRAHARYKLFTWQRKVLLNWRRYNIVATSRWQGKTYLAAFICARELLKEWTWFWWRPYREIKFFVPDKENVGAQFFEYLESMIWDMTKIKLPNWDPVMKINKQKYTVTCNATGHILKIISLFNIGWQKELGSATWEGIAADVAIIDEAARIPDSFWGSFHQRAAFETDTFFVISTINEETPSDHWFYRLLLDWEWVDADSNIISHRVTIDENELMKVWKTEKEHLENLEKAKESLRLKGDKEFYAKWYCIILDESNVFNTSNYLTAWNQSKYADSDMRILWFDLWKLTDTCWLVLINLKHMEIEEALQVTNATYWTQLEYAKEYKQRFKNLLIIGDRSWVWEAVSEQDVEWVVDTWIKTAWQWDLNYNKKMRYYSASKWLVITNMATVFNNRILRIPNMNWALIEQMNNFIKLKSWRWEVLLYKGKGKKKDDLVLSCAYAIFYMYSILWLKCRKDVEEFVTQTWNNTIIDYADTSDGNSYYTPNNLY